MTVWLVEPILFSFNTQPPEGGWRLNPSTFICLPSFNTQPPEGGWAFMLAIFSMPTCFNTQPPEGGWGFLQAVLDGLVVSTHSRLKAAGLVDHDFPSNL